MKLLISCIFLLFAHLNIAQAQPVQRYSATALQQDLKELQRQLYSVHANPFTEYSRQQYNQLFADIQSQLTDSLKLIDFYKMVKPVMAGLSDEHAEISLPASYYEQAVFLPFSIGATDAGYQVDELLVSNNNILKKGDVIRSINGVSITQLTPGLSSYTTGFPEQRKEKALQLFGYVFGLSTKTPAGSYSLGMADGRKLTVAATTATTWMNHLKKLYGVSTDQKKRIVYIRYGKTGYINARSFSTSGDADFKQLEKEIDSIFVQIQKDSVLQLVIDVSKNSGGNSAVGTAMINYFYGKPYKSYQVNWKRSDEYLKTYLGYGAHDERYEKLKAGQVLHYDSDQIRPLQDMPARFKGKVYVLIGNGTFSSAMMFATVIKDNKIAELIGETPKNGHPSHFGELYSVKLPNTQLGVRFGVKEWIRPAGQTAVNLLIPDHQVLPDNISSVLDYVEGSEGSYSLGKATYAVKLDTLKFFDAVRNRQIPVAIYQPQVKQPIPAQKLIILSHGYWANRSGAYLAYTYLTKFLAMNGYMVVSIQHELPGDELMPLVGDPQVVRLPFWERGSDNILYVLNTIAKKYSNLDMKDVTLIGHSNGGDMTALFAAQHSELVNKIITLDNRRVALPRALHPRVYSLRSSDQPADPGVLPSKAEQEKFRMTIFQLPNTIHNDMDDQGTYAQQMEIITLVAQFLKSPH